MSELETGSVAEIPNDVAVSAPEAAPAPEVTTEDVEVNVDSDLQAIWDKNHKARDETGRFQSNKPVEATPPAEKTSDQAPDAKAAEPGIPAIPAPHSWSAEMKAKWDTLPPDVRETIAKREGEAHSRISAMGEQVKAFEPIRSVLERHRGVFETNGIQPDKHIDLLLNVQADLNRDPVTAIQEIAKTFKVDLSMFANGQTEGGQQPETAALRHQISALERQVRDLSSNDASRRQQAEAAELSNIETQINEFLKDKTDFDLVESDVAALIPAIRAKNPGMSAKDVLAKAYEDAQWINPEARQRRLDAQRKEADAKAAEEAKKKAAEAKKASAVNVRSGQSASGATDDLDAQLRAIAQRAYPTR